MVVQVALVWTNINRLLSSDIDAHHNLQNLVAMSQVNNAGKHSAHASLGSITSCIMC